MRVTRLPGGQLRYNYVAGGCMPFRLSCFCEVGQPYQPSATAELDRLRAKGYTILFARDVDGSPWVSDLAVKL